MNKVKAKLKQEEVKLTDSEKLFVRRLSGRRDRLAERYPFAFAAAAAFGIVSTYYGFEKLIDKIDLFTNEPWILLITGLVVLFITGTLYKKL